MSRLNTGPRRVLAEIIERVLPDYPDIDGATRRSVHTDVAAYVAAQIAAMPGFMRLPYLAAMFGFNWLSLLRYGRPFSRLPQQRQVAYIDLWNDAPIAAMRDFIKLIRSSALFAYFDHPLVLQRLEAARPALPHAQHHAADG